jgi:hypothetical protein
VLVCVNCVLVGKHKGHDCGTIADAASAARKQLAETLAAALGVKDELKATLKNVNETADNILKVYCDFLSYFNEITPSKLLVNDIKVKE